MLTKVVTRRLMVVPLSNNDHGKTTIVRSMVRQGERRDIEKVKRSARWLTSPWGRNIDALVIPRSYQETLSKEFGSVEAALSGVDNEWWLRDLIIFPSHLIKSDCQEIIRLSHRAGLDAIAVTVILQTSELPNYQDCLSLNWNERWTIFNESVSEPQGQIEALGHDLWAKITNAIERR